MLLHGRRLSKAYAERCVLEEVSLGVEAGQHLVLIGQSGCGKSTLLRILNGLIEPDRGLVVFQGKPVNSEDWGAVRRQIGYVLQEGGLFPHLTTGENMALVARNLSWDESRVKRRQGELLELLRLAPELLGRYPRQLSGGQRQRVSLARALFMEPPVVLMDEPLGALDPLVRKELQDDLRGLFVRLGCGLIMVTHDLAEAAHFGHQIALLDKGRIVSQGSYQELVLQGCPHFLELLAAHRDLPCF